MSAKKNKDHHTCRECKNFAAGNKKKGRCRRTDKKRAASDTACGHFKHG